MKAAIGAPGRAGFNPPWSAEADPTENQDIPTGTRTTLHIGSDITRVTRTGGGQPDDTLVLGIGHGKTAKEFFKHIPPTPLELENAIMAVEDEVIRAGKWLAQGTTLCTHDVGIREIARLAGVADGARMDLSVDVVEQQFDLLAAWVQGRPGSSAGIPLDSGFAARLLILREFMHHLQFASISVEAGQTSG